MKKSLFRTTISLLLVLLLSTPSFATEAHIKDEKSISTAHVFPVRPGTDAWKSLTPTERRASTFISAEKVSKMTTPALLETVLNYPYLCDLYAFNTLELAYEVVSERFPALAELINRPDASEVIALFYDIEMKSSIVDYYRIDDLDILNQLLLIQTGRNTTIPRFSTTYVETPEGSEVLVYVNMSWFDHSVVYNNNFNDRRVERKIEEMLETYNSAVLLETYSSTYNCHSYAWYSTSTSNPYWMPEADLYVTDGSYTESTCVAGARVTYTLNGSLNHSGIVAYDSSPTSDIMVRSKWGVTGVFLHELNDCPYPDHITEFWEM